MMTTDIVIPRATAKQPLCHCAVFTVKETDQVIYFSSTTAFLHLVSRIKAQTCIQPAQITDESECHSALSTEKPQIVEEASAQCQNSMFTMTAGKPELKHRFHYPLQANQK